MEELTIFTTMTDPQKRMDPWEEALECYNFFTDNVVIVGKDWPEEFSFDLIEYILNSLILKYQPSHDFL